MNAADEELCDEIGRFYHALESYNKEPFRALMKRLRERLASPSLPLTGGPNGSDSVRNDISVRSGIRPADVSLPDGGKVALTGGRAIDDGNTFVFCDYVDEKHRGCVRGAGHNGPHALCLPPYPQGPVILRESAAPPVVAPVAASRYRIVADFDDETGEMCGFHTEQHPCGEVIRVEDLAYPPVAAPVQATYTVVGSELVPPTGSAASPSLPLTGGRAGLDKK